MYNYQSFADMSAETDRLRLQIARFNRIGIVCFFYMVVFFAYMCFVHDGRSAMDGYIKHGHYYMVGKNVVPLEVSAAVFWLDRVYTASVFAFTFSTIAMGWYCEPLKKKIAELEKVIGSNEKDKKDR